MSDCVGAPKMPVCRENYPFVCSTIKSPDNVPIEFAIENGASVRIVFLNYQSQKHKHKRPCWITPALTERREGFEFVSGVDGKIGESRPSAERANLDARCRFGSTHCYTSTQYFAPHILASLPNEVEVVRARSEFSAVMSDFGLRGQAIRWLFRSAHPCLLPRLRHGRT